MLFKSLVQSAVIECETRKNALEKAGRIDQVHKRIVGLHFRFIIPSDGLHICLREHTHQNYSTVGIFVFATHMLSKSCKSTRSDTLIALLLGLPKGFHLSGQEV